jgi:short-subunit dehydrogenase
MEVEVFATPCDVSSLEAVTAMIASVRAHFGQIDVLVNNAGQIRVAPVDNVSIADFEQAMGVMFWGVVYPTLAVLPEMRQRGAGRIATITSVGGKVSIPHLLPYSCAKFAAVGFCEGLRAEVTRDGVQVTTIVPGLMRTGSHRNAEFGGDAKNEAGWFGLGASLPLLSISAESAARKIVHAIRSGEAERILTPQAQLLSAAHGLWPGFVTDLLTRMNQLLPSPSPAETTTRGHSLEPELPGWWKAATALGRRAAIQLNQYPT